MRRVSLMQAMCMYRYGQRLRCAELKTGWTKVAKFASYMYISKVSQPFLSAKMAWCNFCLSLHSDYLFAHTFLVSHKVLTTFCWSLCALKQ